MNKSPKLVGTKEEVEKFNERPELDFKSPNQFTLPEPLPVTAIDLSSYLSPWAKSLYQTELGTTVIEYVVNPANPAEWAFNHDIANMFINPAEESRSYPFDTAERKTALVGYFGVLVSVEEVTGAIPAEVRQRFAAGLEQLLDLGVWEFGTLMAGGTIVLPLARYADGTPTTSWDWDKATGPYPTITKNEATGVQVVLLQYIGVAPNHQDLILSKDRGAFNDSIALEMVNEGALPTKVWK